MAFLTGNCWRRNLNLEAVIRPNGRFVGRAAPLNQSFFVIDRNIQLALAELSPSLKLHAIRVCHGGGRHGASFGTTPKISRKHHSAIRSHLRCLRPLSCLRRLWLIHGRWHRWHRLHRHWWHAHHHGRIHDRLCGHWHRRHDRRHPAGVVVGWIVGSCAAVIREKRAAIRIRRRGWPIGI